MAVAPSRGPVKVALIEALKAVPPGRVTTFDELARALSCPPRLIAILLDTLTPDERDIVAWHRVVAKGGAMGRGPHREAQFARLVREGVVVSPAGIVQDLARTVVTQFDAAASSTSDRPTDASQPPSRSRGMLRHR